jgi:chemotaxis protein histidine kinase CheA
MNNDLQSKLNELKKAYLKKLENVISNLENILASKIDINGLYSIVHTTSGTSGMYGLQDLSSVSTEFEFYLKQVKENSDLINQDELKNKLTDYIRSIKEIVLTGE